MKTVRMSTILKNNKNPKWVDASTMLIRHKHHRFIKAANERRIMTIFHGETYQHALYAEPLIGRVNTIGFVMFTKSIPSDVSFIIGVEKHMDTLMKNSI